MGFPGSDNEESGYSAGDPGLIPGLERFPGGGHGDPLQYPCLENLHGQRSLVGYSPWGYKESDTTDRLSTPKDLFTTSGLCKIRCRRVDELFAGYPKNE